MFPPLIRKNDSQARWLIGTVSFVIFSVIVILGRVKVDADPGY